MEALNIGNNFMEENELNWENCSRICTDGSQLMSETKENPSHYMDTLYASQTGTRTTGCISKCYYG